MAQTRAALVAAGRTLFGRDGFAATSVEDLAREARVTTGALYHHFPTKTKLFEAVFMTAHDQLIAAATSAAAGAPNEVESLGRAFDSFLDAMLEPDLRHIVVVDAPAVLGLARFTELDERYAVTGIVAALDAAVASGRLAVAEPETLARLLLGSLTRGAMLIANSPEPGKTRDEVASTMRAMLAGFAASPGSR
ncbi:MAG TPA: TetR/AcrR family transcriptional regulator [Streptosporangiaceae bacterium]|nr:TetR/AcrR family transcriptional regulator [Streptosporangiaceae bacterium]